MNHGLTLRSALLAGAVAAGFAGAIAPSAAFADKIRHPTAVFAGLDKITGRIISFDVASEETVQFGSLQVTPRACFTRPATEAPQTTGFVEIEEVIDKADNKKIFSGWMFAASPGLHGVEHAVYDVWLTDCKGGSTITRETAALPEENVLAPPPPRPGTVPRPRTSPAPGGGQQARPADSPVLSGPLDGAPPAAAQRPRPPGSVPPGNIPVAAAPQRRAPTQSFFPTFSNSGDNFRERDRAIERIFER